MSCDSKKYVPIRFSLIEKATSTKQQHRQQMVIKIVKK